MSVRTGPDFRLPELPNGSRAKMSFEPSEDRLLIVEPTYGRERLGVILLGLATIPIAGIIAYTLFRSGDPLGLVIAVIAAIMILFPVYIALLGLLNRREIRVEPTHVERRNRPLPWTGAFRIPTGRIRGVRVVEQRTLRTLSGRGGAHYLALHLVLDDASEEVLVLGHRDHLPRETLDDLAAWLERQLGLERELEIEAPSRPIRGSCAIPETRGHDRAGPGWEGRPD